MKNKISEITANIYLIIICFMPLYFENKYFNMIEAKLKYFIVATVAVSAVLLILAAVGKTELEADYRLCVTDFFLFAFGFVMIVGNLLSDYKSEALAGSEGWGMGTVYMLLCIVSYFVVSKFIKNTNIFINTFLVVNIFVLGLGILNGLSIDPLNMNENIASLDYGEYFSTIGNTNWYAEYLCLVLPLAMVLFLSEKNRKMKAGYGMIIVIALFNSVVCNSDSVFIMFGGIVIYLCLFALQNEEHLKSTGTLLLIIGPVLLSIGILDKFNLLIVSIGKLQQIITSIYFAIPVIVIGILFRYKRTLLPPVLKYGRTVLFIVGCFCWFAVCLCFILCNVTDLNMPGIIGEYFTINDTWGTNRGLIWKYAVSVFNDSTWLHKIFGNGCDTFGILVNSRFGEQIKAVWNMNVANAHNEFLQLLVCTGVFGVFTYYGAFIYTSVKGITNKNVLGNALALSLITLILQGFVNNFQPITMPFTFIFLGILRNGNTTFRTRIQRLE